MQTAPRQKVLVVDDDLRLRDLLKRYLGEQGFAVDTVPDAAAMDRQMQRSRYDLRVLDLMLPGEDEERCRDESGGGEGCDDLHCVSCVFIGTVGARLHASRA